MLESAIDVHSGVQTRAKLDPATGDMYVFDIQECSDVIRRCTAERLQDKLRGHRKIPFMGHQCVAEIPVVLVDALKAKGMDVLNDKEALRRFLNDPEWRAFRCSEGRV